MSSVLGTVVRGADSKSSYYCQGTAGKKYRYTAGDKESRDRAKALATKSAPKKTGGATPRKPRPKTVSSAARAKQKLADISNVKKTAIYRQPASSLTTKRK